MGMLSDNFYKIIHSIGMAEFKHPIFYNSPRHKGTVTDIPDRIDETPHRVFNMA